LPANQIEIRKEREINDGIGSDVNREYMLLRHGPRTISEPDWQVERRDHFCE